MQNRRNFIAQSSMAATALLATKSFKTFARLGSPITSSHGGNSLLFIHTGNFNNSADFSRTAENIQALRSKNAHTILLHAGTVPAELSHLNYAAPTPANKALVSNASAYKLIYESDLKIGVISCDPTENNSLNEINTLASYLKKVRKCNLVVCLSQLGYKNKHSIDDMKLASGSSHVDVILGGHTENFSTHPVVALNKNNEEVIINHSAGNSIPLGKILIGFNKGQKNNIAFKITG